MKIRSVLRTATVLLISVAALSLMACGDRPYKQTNYNFAGRVTPPSQLDYRVGVTVTGTGIAGTGGYFPVLDALRDIRFSVFNVNQTFSITGFSATNGVKVFNYPEQQTGFVYSYNSQGSADITSVDYGKEQTVGTTAQLGSKPNDVFVPSDGQYVYAAQESTGTFIVSDRTAAKSTATPGTNYGLSLPGVYKVAANPSHTVVLAMVRNSDLLYRLIKLNTEQTPPASAISCMPVTLPIYCLVPVPGTYDRPYFGYFAPDGAQLFLLNCGQECGGTAASVSTLNVNALRVDNYDTTTNPITRNVAVDGATVAVSDGSTLYVAGQKLVPADGLFSGVLSTINQNTGAVTGKYDISDGTHTKILLADDNTLWIGSQNCASGERKKNNLNYNCLTRFDRGANSVSIIPAVTPGTTSTVPYPNDNGDPYYYGSLTGLCWVQNFHKMYTAYGGQVHVFKTTDGSEIDNYNVTVTGTALDVVYLDAATNAAN